MNPPNQNKQNKDMENKYDSTKDTLEHIKKVALLLNQCAVSLIQRGNVHDNSKLVNPEKEAFDRMTPILKDLKYGTPEYSESLKELGVALQHHYEKNSHHPEHYPNGIDGMDLFDVMEMLMDWKAASERTKEGDILKGLDINQKRFNISPQLYNILLNTVKNLGWEKEVLKHRKLAEAIIEHQKQNGE
jgi:6-phosphogluconate dehydrogenase (decarboxylating)